MIETEEMVGGGRHVRAGLGQAWIRLIPPNLIVAAYDGIAEADFFDAFAAVMNPAAERERLLLFVDGSRFKSYQSGFREKWTTWFMEHRHQLIGLHMLVRSPILKMGLQLVSLAAPGLIHAYSERQPWEEAVAPPQVSAFRRFAGEIGFSEENRPSPAA